VADDVIESEGRQWLRGHQGRAFCARCVARELPADAPLIRAALEGAGDAADLLPWPVRLRDCRPQLWMVGWSSRRAGMILVIHGNDATEEGNNG
jgi:hypothetical protein